jgi:hypothetical protein
MLKASAHHIVIKDLVSNKEKGFLLTPDANSNYNIAVNGCDSLASKTSNGDTQYGDFTNVSIYAQSDWSGQDDKSGNLVGPGGIKYWTPDVLYSNIFPTRCYYKKKNIDISVNGEIKIGNGFLEIENFPYPEDQINCYHLYNSVLYVGLKNTGKILKTSDYGVTWTVVVDLSTDPRSQFNVLTKIKSIYWSLNAFGGVNIETMYFIASTANDSSKYVLQYNDGIYIRDPVKEANQGGTDQLKLSILISTTISTKPPTGTSAVTGTYSGIWNSNGGRACGWTLDNSTKVYVGDTITFTESTHVETYTVAAINTSNNKILTTEIRSTIVGAGTYTVSRTTDIPIELANPNHFNAPQGMYLRFGNSNKSIYKCIYSQYDNNLGVASSGYQTYEKSFNSGDPHNTTLALTSDIGGPFSVSDGRWYIRIYLYDYASDNLAINNTVRKEYLHSIAMNGSSNPQHLKVVNSETNLFVVCNLGNNLNYNLNRYAHKTQTSTTSWMGGSNQWKGINPISEDLAYTVLNLSCSSMDIRIDETKAIIGTYQYDDLGISCSIYEYDGSGSISASTITKVGNLDLIDSTKPISIKYDASNNIYALISPQGRLWKYNGTTWTLVYEQELFDDNKTYPSSLEYWNGKILFDSIADSAIYQIDPTNNTITALGSLDITDSQSNRIGPIMAYNHKIFVETNVTNKTFEYSNSPVDTGVMTGSIYSGQLPSIDKTWIYTKVITKGWTSNDGQAIRLEVSFDYGTTWKYVPIIKNTALSSNPSLFTNYESNYNNAVNGIEHKFYFPYNTYSRSIQYRLTLIKGSTLNPIINDITIFYLLKIPKELIYTYNIILSNRQTLEDGSNKVGQHLIDLDFLKTIWNEDRMIQVTHVDGEEIIGIPFRPAQLPIMGGMTLEYKDFPANRLNKKDINYNFTLIIKSIEAFK